MSQIGKACCRGGERKRRRRKTESASRVERDAPCYRVRPPPHRTVRAVFPHTALRVGLVSSVSLPFAPRLRFTLIPMDAPPYGRAVSDAPPHSGLSPIAVFRHYCSRHLICIVPFTRRGPSLHRHYPASLLLWPHPTPRFAFALPRSPKFLTELSPRVLRLCPVCSLRPMPIGRFAKASPLVMAGQQKCTLTRLSRRFTCVRTHGFVRRDSRTSVALRTARPPTHITTYL